MDSSKTDHKNDNVKIEEVLIEENEVQQSICVKDIKIEPSYHNEEVAREATQSTYCEEEDQQTHFKIGAGVEKVNSQPNEPLKTQKTNPHIVGEEKKSIDDILKVLQARYDNKEIEHITHGNLVEQVVAHHSGDVEIAETQVINSKVVVDLPFGCRCTLSLVYRKGALSIKQVSMLHTHQVSSEMAPYYAINRDIKQSELKEMKDFEEIAEIEEMKPTSTALQKTLTEHFKRPITLEDANNVHKRLKSLQYVCSVSTSQVLKGNQGRPRKNPLPHNENNVEKIENNNSKNEHSFTQMELEETAAIEIDIGETGNIQNIKRVKRINLKSPQYEKMCVSNDMLNDKSSSKPNNLINKSNKMLTKPNNSNSNINSSFNIAFAAACMAEKVTPNSFQKVMKQYLITNNLPIINHPLPDQEVLDYYSTKYQALNNTS